MKEGFPRYVPQVEQPLSVLEREQLRDELFQRMVAEHVITSFTNDLAVADIDEAVIEDVEHELTKLTEDEKRMVLSLPAQLRVPLFKKYAGAIDANELTASGMIHNLLANARRHGYGMGFHLSKFDIRPEQDGSWYVRGTEKDHRHNDRPMAYYSNDYLHRYKEKQANYLYVVRAETGENSGHYSDNDGSWGHASTLSIVDQVVLADIESALDARMKQFAEFENTDAATEQEQV